MQRDEMPVDILFVGAGPACLAGAIRLKQLVQAHNDAIDAGGPGDRIDDPMIAVIEKGSEVGAHQLSGAVVDPRALDELLPAWRTMENAPVERWVEREEMVFLTPKGAIKAPWIPPELINHHKPIMSLGTLCKWLAQRCEELGISIFPGFAGTELLWEGEQVIGVRTGDKGTDKHGTPKDNFQPGMDLKARVTIIGEGPRGHLARRLIERKGLDKGKNPMAYELGCKEILELPPGTVKDGFVIHTLGYPLDMKTFGGSFLYSLGGDRVCIGILAALDAADPNLDVHYQLQLLKNHPYIRSIIGEGKVVKYGAKAVSISGWNSIPQLATDGAMLVGDSASFLNPMRVKGIHLSMKSGMLAAEGAFEALRTGDATAATLSTYPQRLEQSWVATEMKQSGNMHANFGHGFLGGLARTGVDWLFGTSPQLKPFTADYTHMHTISDYYRTKSQERPALTFDGKYLVDKLTDVYMSGTLHDEHQPAHLKIVDTEVCATVCKEQYGNPCTKFCPAQVYNMRPNETTGRLEMAVDFSNCVHCKTCDIRDPYQIITWVPPEGGNGPEYHQM
jgi:electron-transferring-flavoprotein dehydrogenase